MNLDEDEEPGSLLEEEEENFDFWSRSSERHFESMIILVPVASGMEIQGLFGGRPLTATGVKMLGPPPPNLEARKDPGDSARTESTEFDNKFEWSTFPETSLASWSSQRKGGPELVLLVPEDFSW